MTDAAPIRITVPNLHGSGGGIGDGCTVAVGVHVYTHDNIAQTVSGSVAEIERAPITV